MKEMGKYPVSSISEGSALRSAAHAMKEMGKYPVSSISEGSAVLVNEGDG